MEDGRIINIAIVNTNMELGGVEKSLLSLLCEMSFLNNIKVEVLLFEKTGALLQWIPRNISVKEIKKPRIYRLKRSVTKIINKAFRIEIVQYLKKVYHKIGSKIISFDKGVEVEYDVVIAYTDGVPTWYTSKKIKAKKKLAFVHTDFSMNGYNIKLEQQIYEAYDRVYFVSKKAKEKFSNLIMIDKNKLFVFFNIVKAEDVMKMASVGDTFTDEFSGIRLLTVGRLSFEKGIDRIPYIMQNLQMDGFLIKWYIVGEGQYKREIQKTIKRLKLEKNIVLIGELDNPFGYMKSCDIYVQPSRHEGFCIALSEAKALGKPIITCDFAGADEQIINEVTGLIVNNNAAAISDAITKILKHNDMINLFSQNLSKEGQRDYSMQLAEFFSYIMSNK